VQSTFKISIKNRIMYMSFNHNYGDSVSSIDNNEFEFQGQISRIFNKSIYKVVKINYIILNYKLFCNI